jgi:pyruvate,water dikinase
MTRLVHPFTDASTPELPEVGGKGLSLIRMTRAGLAVPPGFVLTVAFFEPWLDALARSPAWAAFSSALQEAPLEALKERADALKAEASGLGFDEAQRRAIAGALAAHPPGGLFAVRSSSPEEDLEGSSFAGGYETVLGVSNERIEDAVRRAFASCLDARVVIYKREHGFDPRRPRIAVVVQRQIASEVAGVGFSLDPLTNAHDTAVFSANFGLGETVVAGIASPDLFTVDKIARAIVGRQVGKKETSIWLTPGGGTEERPDPRHDALTLSDEQILALTDQIVRIEDLYGKPMDIEWAFSEGALYLLQARPITTHLALPPDMVTARGAQKRLYWDLTISVQGLFEPMSPMGTAILSTMVGEASRRILGRVLTEELDDAIVTARHGRLYMNLSNVLMLADKAFLVGATPVIDPLLSAALAGLDEAEYRSGKDDLKKVPWSLLWSAPARAAQIFEARLLPEHARRGIERELARHVGEVHALAGEGRPFGELYADVMERTVRMMFEEILPFFAVSKLAMKRIRGIFEDATPEQRALVDRLDQSLPGNVTVEMGLALAELSRLVPRGRTAAELERALAGGEAGEMAVFAKAWGEFLGRYGHRGPRELDVAAPRYRDQPRMLLEQIVQLAGADPEQGPIAVYERSQRERHDAFEALSEVAHARGWLSHKRFQSLYRVVESLGGYRETPKFCLILAVDLIRGRALAEGEKLVSAGRLDRREAVFDLGISDLVEGLADPAIDLRARAAERRIFIDRLARFRELPRLFDSRGRIFRAPPPPLREGEIAGHPISPGIVRGPIKVLHTPDEKPLLPGEVLVARATDPGWTPLFVNAAAVILEVGGVMQHGALVAREYGKPCVAGVEGATSLLRDGMMVEVDGAAGIVRFVQ